MRQPHTLALVLAEPAGGTKTRVWEENTRPRADNEVQIPAGDRGSGSFCSAILAAGAFRHTHTHSRSSWLQRLQTKSVN